MKDFENSANSGVLLLEFVLGLPYLQESTSEIYTSVKIPAEQTYRTKRRFRFAYAHFFPLKK